MESSIFKSDCLLENELNNKSIENQIQESIEQNKEFIIKNIGDGKFEFVFYNPEVNNDLQDTENSPNDNKHLTNIKEIKNELRQVNNSKSKRKKRIRKAVASPAANYHCTKCKQGYNDLELFRKHLKKHENDKEFKCVKCLSGFHIENNLKIHMVVVHSECAYNEAGLIICTICKIRVNRKASLKSHMIIHQVDECFEEFDKDEEYVKRNETDSLKSSAKLSNHMICRYCKLNFVSATEFKEHLRKHIEIKRKILNKKKSRRKGVDRNDRQATHKCRYCEKTFPKTCLLIRHERIHTGEKPFTCQICLKPFSQKSSLKSHLYSHTGIKPHSCQLCPAKFSQKGNLRCHIQKTHMAPQDNRKFYKCTQCTCIFKRISTLNAHVTKIHLNDIKPSQQQQQFPPIIEEINVAIDDGEQTAETTTIILKSRNGRKSPVLQNKLQQKSLSPISSSPPPPPPPVEHGSTNYVKLAESQLNGNIRHYLMKRKIIGDVPWFFCNFCSNRFKKPSDLMRHYRHHTNEKPYKCNQCNQSFTLKHTLQGHLQTHKTLAYKCLYCDHEFKSLINLKLHLGRHNKKNHLTYLCKICDSKFTNLNPAKEHVITHYVNNKLTNVENLIKPIVEDSERHSVVSLKKISQKSTTKKEILDSIEKPFECTVCTKQFASTKRLREHRRIHTADRKLKCPFCPRTFTTKGRLNEHLNRHQNVQENSCNYCFKKFTKATMLDRHLLIKHEHFNSYICEYCNKETFQSISLLMNHIRDVHNVIVENRIGQEINEPVVNHSKSIEQNDLKVNLIQNISIFPTGEATIIKDLDQSKIQQQHEEIFYINYDNSINYNENNEIIGFNEDIFPSIKLPNDSLYFNDVTDCSNLFNLLDSTNTPISPSAIHSKSTTNRTNMLDPNLVMNPTTAPSPSANADLLITSPINILSSANDNGLSSVDNIIDNNTFPDFSTNLLPSVTFNNDGSDNVLVNLNKSSETNIDSIQIFCINCHKLFTDMTEFEGHICPSNKNGPISSTSGNINLFITENHDNVVSIQTHNDSDDGNSNKDESTDTKTLDNKPEDKRENEVDNKKSDTEKSIDENKEEKLVESQDNFNRKVCHYCCRKFKKPSDLVRHLRTHTGEKPFKCAQCAKKFSLKGTLASHMKVHTSESQKRKATSKKKPKPDKKMLGCSYCKKKFHKTSTKRVHEKKFHPIEENCSQNLFESLDSAINKLATNMKDKREIIIKIDPVKQENQQPPSSALNEQTTEPDILMDNIDENLFSSGEFIRTRSNSNSSQTKGNSANEELATSAIHLVDGTVSQFDFKLLEDDNFYWDTSQLRKIELTSNNLDYNNVITLDKTTTVITGLPLSSPPPLIPLRNVQPLANVKQQSPQEIKKCSDSLNKKFQCAICEKFYVSKQVLKKHMKNVHLKCTLTMCDICEIGFDNTGTLNQHKRSKHNMFRPYNCQHCDVSFMDEKNLMSHIERMHKESILVQKPSESLNLELNLLFENVLM